MRYGAKTLALYILLAVARHPHQHDRARRPKGEYQAERINSTIKNELFKGRRFSSIGQVRTALKEAIDFYNTQRPHMSLDMRTPSQMAHHRGEVRKLWRSYRQEAIKRMAAEPHI